MAKTQLFIVIYLIKMSKKKKYVDIAEKALGVVTGETNPSVTILNLRNLPDGDSKKEEPNPALLQYGQIAINYSSTKEKIFFKNSAGELAVFDTSKNIFIYVDEKDKELQDQIDIINGDDTVDGSFAHADKVLEEKLTPMIQERILSVEGTKGIKAVTDNSKNVTLEGVVHNNDKVLSVDNSGFTTTIFADYDWASGTIRLMGKNANVPISEFKIQTGEKLISAEPYIGVGNETPQLIRDDLYLKYSFGTGGEVHEIVYCHLTPILPKYKGKETKSATITIDKTSPTSYDVSADVKISNPSAVNGIKNTIEVLDDGLMVKNVYDAGTYTLSSRDDEAKLQHLRSSTLNEQPLPSQLRDGEIAINNYAGHERLFIKNSNNNQVAIFDTTTNILNIVDTKIADEIFKLIDPNRTSSLQYQINYEVTRAKAAEAANAEAIAKINGNESLNGSFAHADKVLKDELLVLIDNITGGTGSTVTIFGGDTKTASVDYNTATKTITANVNVSSEAGNNIVIKDDGLFSRVSELNAGTF